MKITGLTLSGLCEIDLPRGFQEIEGLFIFSVGYDNIGERFLLFNTRVSVSYEFENSEEDSDESRLAISGGEHSGKAYGSFSFES